MDTPFWQKVANVRWYMAAGARLVETQQVNNPIVGLRCDASFAPWSGPL